MNIEGFYSPICKKHVCITYYKLNNVGYLIEEKYPGVYTFEIKLFRGCTLKLDNIKKELSDYNGRIILSKGDIIFISSSPENLDGILYLIDRIEKFIRCSGKRY